MVVDSLRQPPRPGYDHRRVTRAQGTQDAADTGVAHHHVGGLHPLYDLLERQEGDRLGGMSGRRCSRRTGR